MSNTYIDNKKSYKLLKNISLTNATNDNNDNKLIGGASKQSFQIISDKEKNQILKDYNEIVSGDKKCTSYPRKQIESAASGIYINENERKGKKDAELCDQIKEAHQEKKDPFVHNDSITAWGNEAVKKYGLTVGDIMKLKFGDKIEVIMFDRNIGDYTSEKKEGNKYDPKKEGCTYATYIHGEGLTGILDMYDIGVVHAPFIWEVNLEALGEKTFWGPIDFDKCAGCPKKDKSKKQINIYEMDKNIKVGWRGPAVLMSNAKKYLPNLVVHYDTWWDDYMPFNKNSLI